MGTNSLKKKCCPPSPISPRPKKILPVPMTLYLGTKFKLILTPFPCK